MKTQKNPFLAVLGCLLLVGSFFLWRGGQHIPALLGGGIGVALIMLFGSSDF